MKKVLVSLLVLAVMVSSLGLIGCQSDTGPTGDALKEPIKIGFLAPFTGTFAAPGTDMRDGFLLYLEEHEWVLGGHPVDLIVEDTAGNPGVALTKARKLVESDGVDILVGTLLASEGYAVAEYAKDNKITLILPIAASDDLTKELVSDYVLRCGWSGSQVTHPFGDYVYNELGYRKVALIGMDYAFGYETLGGFQYAFEQLGGEVVTRIWTPIGVPDFGPYLASIPTDVDAVVSLYVGGDATRFIPAYAEYGLKDKLPLLGVGTLTDESTMQTMGDECIGLITALHYSGALDTPENKAYAEAFRKRYGRQASYYNEGPYTSGIVLDAVLEIVEDFRDPLAFAEAFRTVPIQSPRGPMTIDEYNNPVFNVYVRKVEKIDGELKNIVIHTYPEVSQFWTWDPDEYMARPVYTRDHPAVK
ncbi:MAG: ABC transporter substrate-binding protein [Bacillota bacterium]